MDATPPRLEDKGRDTVLCRLDEIGNPGGRGFRVGKRERLFVIRNGGSIYGYINLCPHQGTTLDWKPDTFLTVEKDYIICGTHGALFTIRQGVCVNGPCQGRRLAPVKLRIENSLVMLDE